jgi:hypothetical protein
MNFSPAFLHGETIVFGLLLGALIGLIGGPLLLYMWLWHTKVSELNLTVGYLILMAILCVVFSWNSPSSMLSLIASGLGFFLSLPWSVLAGWVLSGVSNFSGSDRQFALLMMGGAGINAVLLYLAARKMRRTIE